ncbi:MAG: Fur family transcriptional regulator [bacterium]
MSTEQRKLTDVEARAAPLPQANARREALGGADPTRRTRMSRQRRAILEQFSRPGRHLTADMVYDSVRRSLPSISMGTVYRNLDRLCSEGRIRKLPLCGTQSWYDGGVHPHAHVRCLDCGAIRDVEAEAFADLDAVADDASEYDVVGHELQFYGLCPACRARNDGANPPVGRRAKRAGDEGRPGAADDRKGATDAQSD